MAYSAMHDALARLARLRRPSYGDDARGMPEGGPPVFGGQGGRPMPPPPAGQPVRTPWDHIPEVPGEIRGSDYRGLPVDAVPPQPPGSGMVPLPPPPMGFPAEEAPVLPVPQWRVPRAGRPPLPNDILELLMRMMGGAA